MPVLHGIVTHQYENFREAPTSHVLSYYNAGHTSLESDDTIR